MRVLYCSLLAAAVIVTEKLQCLNNPRCKGGSRSTGQRTRKRCCANCGSRNVPGKRSSSCPACGTSYDCACSSRKAHGLCVVRNSTRDRPSYCAAEWIVSSRRHRTCSAEHHRLSFRGGSNVSSDTA